MRAQLSTLDGLLHSWSADEAELSWHMFGGPMLATLPGDFSETDRDAMRMARLEVDGRWDKCWGGFVTGDAPSKVEGAGLNYGLSIMRPRGWPIAVTQISGFQVEEFSPRNKKPKRGWHRVKVKGKGWVRRRDDAQNSMISVEPNNDALAFKYSKGQDYWAGSYASALIELDTTDNCSMSFAWWRPDNGYRIEVFAGVPKAIDSHGDRWTWTSVWSQAAGSGPNSNGAVATSTVAGCTALLVQVSNPNSIAPSSDRNVRLNSIIVYGTSVTSPFPATIMHLMLDNASPLLDTSVRDIATGDSSLVPFDTDGTPLDLGSHVLSQTGGRFFWRHTRSITGRLWVPTYRTVDESVAYRIYAPESELSAVDVEHSATHALVTYSAPDGGTLTMTRSTTDGYLGRRGIEKWTEVDATHTTDATHAAALGDLALAEAAYDRHAGTVTIETIKDANGAEVPLEHIEWGHRAELRSAGKTITPVMTEGRLVDGKLEVTLDDSPHALDIALANLAR